MYRRGEAIFLNWFHESECVSAMRLKVFRGECDGVQAGQLLAQIEGIREREGELPDQGALERWWQQIEEWRATHGLWTGRRYGESQMIMPQQVIESLYRATDGEAYVTSDVGQHQMMAARFYNYQTNNSWFAKKHFETQLYMF